MKTRQMKAYFPYLVMLACVLGVVFSYLDVARTEEEPTNVAEDAKPAVQVKATSVGSDTCVACHSDAKDPFNKHVHGLAMIAVEAKGRGHLCEGCHGPGSLHAEEPSAETAAVLKATARSGQGCFNCHGNRLSPTKWHRSAHQKAGVTCLACHGQLGEHRATGATARKPVAPGIRTDGQPVSPHGDMVRAPSTDTCLTCHGEKRAEISLPYHHPVKEGRITCADCHDVHAPIDRKIQRDTCVTCHAKQRGPFRFEHGAISGKLSDACLDCHRPHGSPNARLLKFNSRGLCLQCHADRVNHFPGRQCWSCHDAVHGSNSSRLLLTK